MLYEVITLYFRAKDSAYEVSKMPNAVFRPIESIWGHFAGGWFYLHTQTLWKRYLTLFIV